jgi:hypothetical protein
MLPVFIAALRTSPPEFPPALRIKRVQGSGGVCEITFAPDGRATFVYGTESAPTTFCATRSSVRRLAGREGCGVDRSRG